MSTFKIESGVQLLARLAKKTNIEGFYPVLFQSGPTNGDIIEIFGAPSTSHLLLDIISEVLIQTKLKGEASEVLFFNTDGNFKFDELVNVIKRKTWTRISSTSTQDNDICFKTVHDMLAKLFILNIYNATQLYTTIYNLENTLVEHPNTSIIIIDTLTAFYWSEQGFKITKMDLYTKNLINLIQKVTKEYKTICIYTRPEYFCTNKDSQNIPTEINYQVQLLDNDIDNYYQVNIKMSSIKITKFFTVINNDLTWI